MSRFTPPHLPQTPDVADSEWGEIDAREALHYDAETDTYRARTDGRTGSVALEVVAAVATVSDTHPLELPPLYDDVDPDAFDALTALTRTDAAIGETLVAMTYASYDVAVHGDGVISVRPPPAESTRGV